MRITERVKTHFYNKLHLLKIQELFLPDHALEEFEELYKRYIEEANGENIIYKSAYPKYMFLHYLIENKDVFVHGTNHSNITLFEPREQDLFNGKKVKAVFASTDGVWSIFFAVVNRKEYVGSLRNMCLTTRTKKGIRRYYYFSLNKDFLGQPYIDGTIYILPKDGFKKGGIRDEWVSERPVTPLAKLTVTPEDFIFNQNIKRHKETTPPIKSMIKALVLNQ